MLNRSHFRAFLVCFALASSAIPAAAQDVTVAAAPDAVVNGPRALLIQKSTQGIRWRALNATLDGWGPWTWTPTLGAHFDGYDRMALAAWNDHGFARYQAFEAVVGPQGDILVGEVAWNYSQPSPVGVPALRAAPVTAVGAFFFPADAVGRVFDRSFSIVGTSVNDLGSGIVETPRELVRSSPPIIRDMAGSGASTPAVMFGPFSTTMRDAAFTNFERTTAVMHQHASGSRTVSLYRVRDVIDPAAVDTRIQLGSPPGVMTQPPILFIHDAVQPGPMNLFTVARDASGRRRLFERTTAGDAAQLAGWSGWKNWDHPPAPPAAAVDDLEITIALVWREPGTNRLRVNMFGTRAGQLVERHWGGTAWAWGASRPLPAPGMKLTDGVVVKRPGQWPRLSIVGVTPAGDPFECVYDWSSGAWIWQAL